MRGIRYMYKIVVLMGMSGVGKDRVRRVLEDGEKW